MLSRQPPLCGTGGLRRIAVSELVGGLIPATVVHEPFLVVDHIAQGWPSA